MRPQMQLRKYQLVLLALAVIAMVVVLYWQTFSRIVDMWSVTAYQYGWLVYPVSLYVLSTKRNDLAAVQWRTSIQGVLFAALLVLVWAVSREVGVQIVEFAAATLMIFAVFWALAGTDAMRKAAFPLLLLLAAVPMGAFLVEPLMNITAGIAGVLLAVVGVPVLRDGQFFTLPGGSFEVADVCSGLRYLLAGTMVALAFAYVTYSSNVRRLIFVGIAAIVLVVVNGVRAFIVMTVASATDMRILGGADHVVFGMVLFAVVFVAMILIGERYADPTSKGRQPQVDQHHNSRGAMSGVLIATTIGIVIAGPVFGEAMANRGAPAIADLPTRSFDNCPESDNWGPDEFPRFAKADYEKRTLLVCDDYQIRLFVASYGVQRQGKELISSDNRVWPKAWRQYADRSTASVETGLGTIDVRQVLVREPSGWRMIWYWYQVGASVTSSQYMVKVMEATSALSWRRAESSVVVISAISGDRDNSDELREQLAKHADRVLRWNIERVEQGRKQ